MHAKLKIQALMASIYDLSYIHLYSSPTTGIKRTHNMISPLSWLDSLMGRGLHRYHRGRWFESRSGLNFFRL